MASERRSSFGASSINSVRRLSSSSFQLPPLPPSTESLASGTSIPAPILSAPNPPPKDLAPLAMPVTPQRKPVMRQKSPLSNEAYFSSPASSMPGAFPSTPPVAPPSTGMPPAQISTTAYASASPPSTTSKSPKRPSSVRNLLSFKGLRRSSANSSSESPNFRPMSPGTESTISSPQPSLNKKKSGTFWRRKSSLGMTYGKEGDNDYGSAIPPTVGESSIKEEGPVRSPTPGPGSEFPTMKKRKSGTFWRRKSSLGMGPILGNDEATRTAPHAHTNGTQEVGHNGVTNGLRNVTNRGHENTEDGIHESQKQDAMTGETENRKSSLEIDMISARSWSPPPQLPDFVGDGSGLGAEDMFKDIH